MTEVFETPKMLVISTGHIREETNTNFENHTDSVPGIYYSKQNGDADGEQYGWFIPVGEEIEWSHMVSADLLAIRNVAEREGCHWIMLDRDGPYIEELPVYDW